MNWNKENTIKFVMEFLRVVTFAGIGAALAAALAWAQLIQDPMIQLILVTIFTSAGKAWDRKIHEDQTPRTGILPF